MIFQNECAAKIERNINQLQISSRAKSDPFIFAFEIRSNVNVFRTFLQNLHSYILFGIQWHCTRSRGILEQLPCLVLGWRQKLRWIMKEEIVFHLLETTLKKVLFLKILFGYDSFVCRFLEKAHSTLRPQLTSTIPPSSTLRTHTHTIPRIWNLNPLRIQRNGNYF